MTQPSKKLGEFDRCYCGPNLGVCLYCRKRQSSQIPTASLGEFDPEKVKRSKWVYYDYEGFACYDGDDTASGSSGDPPVFTVDESDYDKLLALYRKLNPVTEDRCDSHLPELRSVKCQKERGHAGNHYCSYGMGSATWPQTQKSPTAS